jgi:hypothetical protein
LLESEPDQNKDKTRTTTKACMALRKLHTFYNLTLKGVDTSEPVEFLFFPTGTTFQELEKFDDAWYHPALEEHTGWRDAVKKELTNMHLIKKFGTRWKSRVFYIQES